MPVGSRDGYFIRGHHPEAEAASLEAALAELLMYWQTRRQLAVHDMGNLVIELSVGGVQVRVEITSPGVLDEFQHGVGPRAVLDELARATGLPPADALKLIETVDSASVRVDTFRVPQDPLAWSPEPGLAVDRVMPQAAFDMLRERLVEADHERSVKGGPRSEAAQELVAIAIRAGEARGIGDTEISRLTGIPRSTLRDSRRRLSGAAPRPRSPARPSRGGGGVVQPPEPPSQAPRRRLTMEERGQVLEAIERAGGNAARAARELGLPERTVRDIRKALETRPRQEVVRTRTRRTYDESVRDRLLDRVRAGESAAAAARALGIRERTARDWVLAARRRDAGDED
jgi:transposase-like protein